MFASETIAGKITSEAMEGARLLFVNLLILLFGFSFTERCDRATTARVQEGNIAQSGDFNWLGVLSVHLHEENKIRMAMTGIILVKMRHALANADDIVRIPKSIFESDSRAMFLAGRDTPWFVKPKSYVTHPEYESYTFNSIALIELNIDEVNDFPLNPICLPSGAVYNTSKYLFLTGFTDENQVMEKVIYKIQYLEKQVCEEFYNRAGLSSQKRIPTAYLCGYAPSNVTQCVWDNGMALVSNASGYFNLIGFGVHGPGCAAPARFIDLFQYFYWINSVTSPDEIYDDPGFRRKEDDEFIPVHELFTINSSLRKGVGIGKYEFVRYPFEMDTMKQHIIRPDEDDKSILIYRFNDTWEQYPKACSQFQKLMYKEHFQLTARPKTTMGSVTYKLSLYDLHNTVASCVRLTVQSARHSKPILSFREEFNFKEGQYETPDQILQVFTGAKKIQKSGSQQSFPDLDRFKPKFITNDLFRETVLNYDLYIKLEFIEHATLYFEMYAEEGGRSPNRSFTTESVTTESVTTEAETTEATTPTLYRRAKLRFRTTKPKSIWGVEFWADNMVREDEVKLGTDVEEVEETESAARGEVAPGPVVMACWLISAFMTRMYFIN